MFTLESVPHRHVRQRHRGSRVIESSGSLSYRKPTCPEVGCAESFTSRWCDANRLGRFGLLSNYQERISTLPFVWRAEALYFIQGNRVQEQVIDQRAYVPRLLSDDLMLAFFRIPGPDHARAVGIPFPQSLPLSG